MAKNDIQAYLTNGTIGATVLAVGRWIVKRMDKVSLGSIHYVDARYEKVAAELVDAKILIVKLEQAAIYTAEHRQALRDDYAALKLECEELRKKLEELRDEKN